MAGDWIKVEHVTPDKPEVHRIAQLLGLDPDTVVGKLVRIWIWADQQTISGNAFVTPIALLDRIAGHPGFAEAMADESVKWLKVTQNSGVIFPNFDRHNGACAKDRAASMKRMKRFRYASGVTKTAPEKRREENNTPVAPFAENDGNANAGGDVTPPALQAVIPESKPRDQAVDYLHNHPGIPKSLDTVNFRDAWERWQRDLWERGIRASSGMLAGQLAELEAMGPVQAIAAIENGITKGLRKPGLPFSDDRRPPAAVPKRPGLPAESPEVREQKRKAAEENQRKSEAAAILARKAVRGKEEQFRKWLAVRSPLSVEMWDKRKESVETMDEGIPTGGVLVAMIQGWMEEKKSGRPQEAEVLAEG